MVGVLATIQNGTDLFTMGDAIEVDFESGQTNFTYNASLGNQVYVRFTPDPNFSGQSFFMAQFGMRAFPEAPKGGDGLPGDNDEEEYITYVLEVIPQSKELTFNERIIIGVFVGGILAMCFSNKYPDAFKSCNYCCGFCKREKRSLDPLEAEFDFKVKKQKYGFEINMSSSSSDEEELNKETGANEEQQESDNSIQIDRVDTEVEKITFDKKVAGQKRKYGDSDKNEFLIRDGSYEELKSDHSAGYINNSSIS